MCVCVPCCWCFCVCGLCFAGSSVCFEEPTCSRALAGGTKASHSHHCPRGCPRAAASAPYAARRRAHSFHAQRTNATKPWQWPDARWWASSMQPCQKQRVRGIRIQSCGTFGLSQTAIPFSRPLAHALHCAALHADLGLLAVFAVFLLVCVGTTCYSRAAKLQHTKGPLIEAQFTEHQVGGVMISDHSFGHTNMNVYRANICI